MPLVCVSGFGYKTKRFAAALTPFGKNTKALEKKMIENFSKKFDKGFPERFEKFLDESVRARSKLLVPSKRGGLYGVTRDADFLNCLREGLTFHEVPYSEKKAVELLQDENPVICSGTWKFGETWYPHAGVVVGYRYDSKTRAIEYYGRNHEADRPFAWTNPKCEKLIYLTKKPTSP